MQTSVPEQARGSLVAALKPLWGCSCACSKKCNEPDWPVPFGSQSHPNLSGIFRNHPKVIHQNRAWSSQKYTNLEASPTFSGWRRCPRHRFDIDQNHSKSLTLDKQMGCFIWFLLKPVILVHGRSLVTWLVSFQRHCRFHGSAMFVSPLHCWKTLKT